MVLPKHLPALDGLRGVAILMVVLTHTAQAWPGALAITQPVHGDAGFSLPFWLSAITRGANHGVQLFFVVSAFTLTLREHGGHSRFVGYAIRRLARVGPGYWLAALAYTGLAGTAARLWAPDGVSPTDVAVAALFGSAWQGGAALAVVPGGWSVCCEVAFYIALPAILWAAKGSARQAAGFTIASIMFATACIAWGPGLNPFHPIPQAPVFLCGVTAALTILHAKTPAWSRMPLWLLLIAIVLLPQLTPVIGEFLGVLAFAAVSAIVVALAASHPPRLLASRAMRAIGQVSYSIYLVHFALLAASMRLAQQIAPANDWRTLAVHFTLTAVGSFALACITYRLIEQPAIRWAHRRLRPAHQPAAATV